ncbi:MAG: S1/P1 nuclease [Longimonas sp.]|uniref:S1/P1 nuclease n=1 Tax=Longimonas sp. TaxID=2039626 RepID=UPI003353778F
MRTYSTRIFCIAALALGLVATSPAMASEMWGRVGHYVTGEIARQHLSDDVLATVEDVLGEESLVEATTWMDRVRPTDAFRHTADWHWVTIPPDTTYDQAHKNPNGDIIEALERKIAALKAGGLDAETEREHLKMVIHMIGDIHQPLHVGTGEDRGGNDVRVCWLGDQSNLHRVWDTGMLVSWSDDYETWANAINLATDEQVAAWQQATVRRWAEESVSYRDAVYDLPENHEIGWTYRNENMHIVEKRLLQAGVRIAGVLTEIYGEG